MPDVKRKANSSAHHPAAASATAALADSSEGISLADSSTIHHAEPTRPFTSRPRNSPPLVSGSLGTGHQNRVPVITGEAHYKGSINVDGVISGQLGGSGGGLGVRQKSKPFCRGEPELCGEFTFGEMVRVNGYIAGTVYSRNGTLIVDVSATVEANVDVAVAVLSGTVIGDIVAHERIVIGPNAKIYGNIWTRSIEIKSGAIFEGVCRMVAEEQIAG